MKSVLYLVLILSFFVVTPKTYAETAVALIQGTAEGSTINGKATFEDTAEGLKITVEVNNVSPGKHGFHIHEFGSCADTGNAAGGHFNPDGVVHGYLPDNGFKLAHAGDFGNMEVDAAGQGKLELTIPGLAVSGGKYDVAGRAVILHEKEDNFGQPTGNAGSRIACGNIVITGK